MWNSALHYCFVMSAFKVLVTPEFSEGGIEIPAGTSGTIGGTGCHPTVPCFYTSDAGKTVKFAGKKELLTLRMYDDKCECSTAFSMCVRVNNVFVNPARPHTMHSLVDGQTAQIVVSDVNKKTFKFDLKFNIDHDPVPDVPVPVRLPVLQAPPVRQAALPRTPVRTVSLVLERYDPYDAWSVAPAGGAAAPQMVYKREDENDWRHLFIDASLVLGRREFPDRNPGGFLFSREAVKLEDDSCTKVVFPGKNGFGINGALIKPDTAKVHTITPLTQISLVNSDVQYALFIGDAPPPPKSVLEHQDTQVFGDYGDEDQTQAFEEPLPVRRRLADGSVSRVPRQLPDVFRRPAAAEAAPIASGGQAAPAIPESQDISQPSSPPTDEDTESIHRDPPNEWDSQRDGAM